VVVGLLDRSEGGFGVTLRGGGEVGRSPLTARQKEQVEVLHEVLDPFHAELAADSHGVDVERRGPLHRSSERLGETGRRRLASRSGR
jgi:hypothetical protein